MICMNGNVCARLCGGIYLFVDVCIATGACFVVGTYVGVSIVRIVYFACVRVLPL